MAAPEPKELSQASLESRKPSRLAPLASRALAAMAPFALHWLCTKRHSSFLGDMQAHKAAHMQGFDAQRTARLG